LYQKLSKDNLFALTWFVPRKNATPVMAAMVPTLSAEGSEDKPNAAATSATGAPQGLHLIPLPYADDIRQNPPSIHEKPVRAPDELVTAMRPIIRK
jgi:ATP-dependent DNA helicase 2 subunit 1